MKTAIIAFILMGGAIPIAIAQNVDYRGYSVESAGMPMAGYDQERLLDAIYRAEGGAKARPAYGVVSWPKCGEVGACRYFASEIVRVHHARWIKAGAKGEFLAYLASRYAPVGAGNDPRGLNNHWYKNVRAFYE